MLLRLNDIAGAMSGYSSSLPDSKSPVFQPQQIAALVDPTSINGPWDMTTQDFGNGNVEAFVSNAPSGNGAFQPFD